MCGSLVGSCAADEFVRAVEVFDETSRAEPRDRGGLENKRVDWCLIGVFNFHGVSMTKPIGHWRSNLENNFEPENQRRGSDLGALASYGQELRRRMTIRLQARSNDQEAKLVLRWLNGRPRPRH